jgi:DNA-binding MarR family transcriptional regulator
MTTDSSISSCNCLALRKAARAVSAYYDRCLAPTGLSAAQYGLLAVICERPGIGMQALSEALVSDRSSLVRAVQPLSRKGYIVQSADPGNARRRVFTLSAGGRQLLMQAQGYWQQAQAAFDHTVGARHARALRGELDAVAQRF